MKGNRVNSIDDLMLSFKRIRDMGEGFITNFFLNPFVASIWIKHHLITKVSMNKTDFFQRSDHNFKHIYYCSASKNALSSDLYDFMKKNKDDLFVIDIIGSTVSTNEVADLFLSNGFNSYTSLVRMTRKPPESSITADIDNGIMEARESDIVHVNKLLTSYFDLYSEQLPHIDELEAWRAKGNILVYKSQNISKGFIIFEDFGYSSYLRYWFVNPHYRNQKVGSKLMSSFFFRTQKSTRQLFWVNRENHNAIKRYLHYGFLPEDLVDLILINKQIQYEKRNN